jgi:hypothetical protein
MSVNLTELIFKKEKFFNEDECQFLIEEYQKLENTNVLEHCPEASTGIDTTSSFKRVQLLEKTEAFKLVHDATETMINDYMDFLDSFKLFHVHARNTMLYSHMYRLLKYETGAKIHAHTDHDPYVYGSCTFNLNDDYTGGDFAFWRGKHKVHLGKGDALIFPADNFWVHEVQEITSGVRYSTNSFLTCVPEQIKSDLGKYRQNLIDSAFGRRGIQHKYKIREHLIENGE